MSIVSEMMIKIGADSSGLSSELKKTQSEVNKAFSPSPVSDFSGAITGATDNLSGMIGKFTGLAALAAGGFGLKSMVSDAVAAGESVYQLQNRYHMTTEEAVQLGRVMSITGGSTDTAAKAIMRLDKNMTENTINGEKARETLSLFGVSLTDSNGKILPMNQQLQALATGYKSASAAGLDQNFIMNTLGVRGMALVKTLQNYDEAAEKAAAIKSIGLDPEEMHEMSLQLKTMDLQLSQLSLAGGSSVVSIAEAAFPNILSGLASVTVYLKDNKQEVADITKEVVKAAAAYEAFKVVKSVGSKVVSTYNEIAPDMAQTVDTGALTAAQEKSIARRIAQNNSAANKEIAAYQKTVLAMEIAEEEKAVLVSQRCAEVESRYAIMNEKLRAESVKRYTEENITAAENAEKQNVSLQSTAAEAEKTSLVVREANIANVESTEAFILANQRVSESLAAIGVESTITAEKTVSGHGAATIAAGEEALANTRLVEAAMLTGVESQVSGGKAVASHGAATIEAGKEAMTVNGIALAHDKAGIAAELNGAKTVGAMAIASAGAKKMLGVVLALAGGWIGVAAAATYATYELIQYAKEKRDAENETYEYNGDQYVYDKGKVSKIGQAEQYDSNMPGTGATSSQQYVDVDADTANQITYMHDIRKDSLKSDADRLKEESDAKIKALEAKSQEEQDDLAAKLAAINGLEKGKKEKEEKDTTVHYSEIDKLGDYANQALYAANTYGLDPNLFGALIQNESSGNPNAYNTKSGATGFSQLMPDTAAELGVNPNDPNENLMGGAAYLSQMMKRFHGDPRLALAAYNAGPGAVENAGGIPKYSETQDYVSDIMGRYQGATTYKGDKKYDQASELKKLQQAKEEASNLYASMTSGIDTKTATTFSTGMDKIAQDVSKKSEEIAKLQAQGVDTSLLSDKLKEYKKIISQDVVDKWREAWQSVKDDTKQTLDQVTDNFEAQAEDEYQITVHKLEEERKKKLDSIAQDKDDKVAQLAVESWFNAQVLAAGKKQTQELKKVNDEYMQVYAQNGGMAAAVAQLGSPTAAAAQALDGEKKLINEYYDLWSKRTKTWKAEQAEAAASVDSGLESIFSDFISGSTTAGKMVESFGKLVISTIAKIAAERLASNITSTLFSSLFGNSSVSLGTGAASYSADSSLVSTGENVISSAMLGLATGGVVTAPTMAMIGEGTSSEAVLPLNASTYSALAGNIAKAGGGTINAPQINISNNVSDNTTVSVSKAEYNEGLQQHVIDIVLDAAVRDKSGFGSNLKTALGSV